MTLRILHVKKDDDYVAMLCYDDYYGMLDGNILLHA